MQRIEFRKWIWAGVLALFLSTAGAVSPVYAQAADDATMQTTTDTDDDGTDWGWIGLLGLAGLLGLRRREHHVEHHDRVDTTRTRV